MQSSPGGRNSTVESQLANIELGINIQGRDFDLDLAASGENSNVTEFMVTVIVTRKPRLIALMKP